jgi:hypothetical protein
LSKRRVLAISSDLDQLRRIVATLERAGAEVDAVRSASAIAADVIPHRYVFFATGSPEAAQILVPKLRDRAHVTVIAGQAKLSELTEYLRDDRFNHVIVGDELEEGVFITAQKLLTGDIFGSRSTSPTGRLCTTSGCATSKAAASDPDRARFRRELEDAAARCAARSVQVCEELLMNALYDAPVDDEGPADLRRGRSARSHDDAHAAAGVDPLRGDRRHVRGRGARSISAGSRRTRSSRTSRSAIHSPNQIDRKTYGAGLGLYLVAMQRRRMW